jgi:hypothetical protein
MSKNLSSNNLDKSTLSSISAFFAPHQILKFNIDSINQIDGRLTGNVKDIFNSYYKLMFDQYRCEYVYKNEIVKQILLKNHPAKARLYTEVEIYDSKADVVIINGTSTVYEIKTELDTFDRLAKQLSAYKLVFDKIYVVTHHSKLTALLNIVKTDVGIMVLNETGKIQKVREAKSNKENIKPEYVFNLLHREEYVKIINDHFEFVPKMTAITIFQTCKKLFMKLNPEIAHDCMVEALRNRSIPVHRKNLLNTLPDSLKLIAASGKLTRKDCENILEKLDSTFKS